MRCTYDQGVMGSTPGWDTIKWLLDDSLWTDKPSQYITNTSQLSLASLEK